MALKQESEDRWCHMYPRSGNHERLCARYHSNQSCIKSVDQPTNQPTNVFIPRAVLLLNLAYAIYIFLTLSVQYIWSKEACTLHIWSGGFIIYFKCHVHTRTVIIYRMFIFILIVFFIIFFKFKLLFNSYIYLYFIICYCYLFPSVLLCYLQISCKGDQ